MTREDIIKLARESGMVYREFEDEFANGNTDGVDLETMQRFAQLVAAAAVSSEREACAKECEHTAVRMGSEWMAHHCAQAIRARR